MNDNKQGDVRKRPLRVAYIVGAFPHISETFIANQIAGVAARGNVVNIFTTCETEIDNIPSIVEHHGLMKCIYRLHAGQNYVIRVFNVLGLLLLHWWWGPRTVLKAINYVREGGLSGSIRLLYATLVLIRLGKRHYDVIHAQFGNYGQFALDLVNIGAMSGAIITSFRGYDATKYLRTNPEAYRELFRRGAFFLPVSQTLAGHLVKAGCDPSKMHVHHSGIECSKLSYNGRDNPRQGGTRLITVARLVEKKGLKYAIQAIARVIASERTVYYTIVGEGPLRGELERLIDKLELTEHVTLMGWKSHDETLSLVQEAHILLAPSVTAADGDEEGIPNSVKEAMAMGLPVVATKHGGIPELVEEGLSGYLVSEHNAEALADRITFLMDHPESWIAMGRAGRYTIEAEFDIDTLNDELVELYRRVAVPEESIPNSVSNTKLEPGTPVTAKKFDSSGFARKVQGD